MVFQTPASATGRRLIIDIVVGCVFGVLGLAWDEGVFGGPAKRGFFRDDQSLMHPYTEDESVSTGLLIIITFILPIIIMPIADFLGYHATRSAVTASKDAADRRRGAVHRYAAFILGFGITVFLTALLKDTVGRLRPDFIARCDPDYSSIPIGQTWIPGSADVCQGEEKVVEKGRRSFPSGHSSVAFYGLVFLAWYLGQVMPKRKCFADYLCLVFQMPLVGAAAYIAASRSIDYAHHGWDVVGGSLLGTVVFAFTAFVILRDHVKTEAGDGGGGSSKGHGGDVELAQQRAVGSGPPASP